MEIEFSANRSTTMQDKREIPAIVNEKIVLMCLKFHTFGGSTLLQATLGNRRIDLHALNNLSSSVDKISFKSSSMSLGLVLLEKLFTHADTAE